MAVLQQLAARRNAVVATGFVTSMQERARERSFANPREAANRYATIVQKRLDNLRPQIADAKRTLMVAQEKTQSGELDLIAAPAEQIPATVVLSLFRMLETMYERSRNSADVYTISRVGIAASILQTTLNDGLLRERTYAKNTEDRKSDAKTVIGKAQTLYRDVLGALDNTHQSLGVEPPAFPALH
ncbi:hypothetical protein KKB44_06115 [Candidatus Micrarchaeota archaeon]|nr:hypothetical protein [Candidatus Micrarchaeota archaeon]